ncbi:MAG: LamG domain-containing protein [Melioribacteraceae bacterium]|nr:LamG domain-containing protein [Melioribacteraceae bacterium]
MKTKILFCIGVIIGMLFFFGCEGPEGPAGPVGPVLAINTIDANPFSLYPGELSTITADYNYSGDSTINFSWETTGGDFVGPTNTAIIQWTAPQTTGFYTITLTLSDNENEAIGHCTIQVISTSGNLPTDYIAYYPFSGNAEDESINGYDGSIYGAILTEDRFGNPNCAYDFDGVDDAINVEYNFLLNGVSICCWFKSDGNDTTQFLSKAQDPYDNWGLWMDADSIAIHDDIDDSNNVIFSSSIDSEWHFAVAILTENLENKLYLDGVLVGDGIFATDSWSSFDGNFYIGQRGTNVYNDFFDGKIDDVRIYDRELTVVEINSLYHDNGWDE